MDFTPDNVYSVIHINSEMPKQTFELTSNFLHKLRLSQKMWCDHLKGNKMAPIVD